MTNPDVSVDNDTWPKLLLGLAATVKRRLLKQKQSFIAEELSKGLGAEPDSEEGRKLAKNLALYLSRLERGNEPTPHRDLFLDYLDLDWAAEPRTKLEAVRIGLRTLGLPGWDASKHSLTAPPEKMEKGLLLSYLIEPALYDRFLSLSAKVAKEQTDLRRSSGFAGDVVLAKGILRAFLEKRKHFFEELETAAVLLRQRLNKHARGLELVQVTPGNLAIVIEQYIVSRNGTVRATSNQLEETPWGQERRFAWVHFVHKQKGETGVEKLYKVPSSTSSTYVEVSYLVDRTKGYIWEGLDDGPSRAFQMLLLYLKMEPGLRGTLVSSGVEVSPATEHDGERVGDLEEPISSIIARLHSDLVKELKSSQEALQGGRRAALIAALGEGDGKSPPWTYLDELIRRTLRSYVAGAVMMPYDRFFESATHEFQLSIGDENPMGSYDIDALQAEYGVSFAMVANRLTTLRRKDKPGLEWSFLRVDPSGAITNSHGGDVHSFDHAYAGCGLWAAYQAPLKGGAIWAQINQVYGQESNNDSELVRAVVARTSVTRGMTYTIAIACDLDKAIEKKVIYFKDVDYRKKSGPPQTYWNGPPIVKTGRGCHACGRSCAQRTHPSVLGNTK